MGFAGNDYSRARSGRKELIALQKPDGKGKGIYAHTSVRASALNPRPVAFLKFLA